MLGLLNLRFFQNKLVVNVAKEQMKYLGLLTGAIKGGGGNLATFD